MKKYIKFTWHFKVHTDVKELLIFIYQFYSACYHGHKKSNNSKPRLSCPNRSSYNTLLLTKVPDQVLRQTGTLFLKKKKQNILHSLADHCENVPPPGLGNLTFHKPVPQILSSLSSTSPAPGSWPQSHLQGHSICPLQEPGPELHRQFPLPVPITAELPTSQMLLGRKKIAFLNTQPCILGCKSRIFGNYLFSRKPHACNSSRVQLTPPTPNTPTHTLVHAM